MRESNAIEGIYDAQSLQDACEAWEHLDFTDFIKPKLTINDILETHAILMKHQDLPERFKGKFRDVDVYVGEHKGAAPELLDSIMNDWVVEANNLMYLDENRIKQLHIAFETCHPLADGNGRIGRMLYNWMKMATGKNIEIFYEKDKHEYYKWFR